jgi:hypothetical protein
MQLRPVIWPPQAANKQLATVILAMHQKGDEIMAKVTVSFGVLLIIVGLEGFFGTGGVHPTALIPTWFGLALSVGGSLAISPSESRRKIFMHVNVTVGLIGLIGAIASALHGYEHARSLGIDPDYKALFAQLTMAILLLIYVILCVRSFIAARRTRQEKAQA